MSILNNMDQIHVSGSYISSEAESDSEMENIPEVDSSSDENV